MPEWLKDPTDFNAPSKIGFRRQSVARVALRTGLGLTQYLDDFDLLAPVPGDDRFVQQFIHGF